MSYRKPSSYSGNLIVLRQAIDSYGINANEVMKEAGIDWHEYESEKLRISTQLVGKLYTLALEKTGDPAFGLRLSEFVSPSSFHALGTGLLFSSTLYDFCQRFIRFYSMVSTTGLVELSQTAESCCLSIQPVVNVSEAKTNAGADCICATLQKYIRMIFKPDYCFKQIDIGWDVPDGHREKYQNLFGCKVRFNTPRTTIYFEPTDMQLPLPSANPELAQQNDNMVIEFMARMDVVDFSDRVHTKLAELLPTGHYSRENVAKSMNMSVSAFRNRLEKEGTSYQDILEQVRGQLSKSYLQRSELSICEVAYSLGFSDSSNFSRSFKRWYGFSPKAYRKELQEVHHLNSSPIH